jgi:hypothetical protein
MQAMVEQRSRTLPFSIALALQSNPAVVAVANESASLRTSIGARMRSPSDGTLADVAQRVLLVGPFALVEVGTRLALELDDDFGAYGQFGMRAGWDATRVDDGAADGGGSHTVTAGLWGSHVSAGVVLWALQLGFAIDGYRVIGQSRDAAFGRLEGRPWPTAELILSLGSVHLFSRVLLEGGEPIAVDGWSAGIGASLYP